MINSFHNPRVTIVMTIRERYSLTIQALQSILSNTPPIYRLIFVDCHLPAWIREQLDILASQHSMEVLRSEEDLWPNQARMKALNRITSEYTVFIDNDVQVEPGWLERLIACADETGAGIVGPLYLWGNGHSEPKIHMAGGKLTIYPAEDRNGFVMKEEHQLVNQRPAEVQDQLYRKPCDFVEYHCMLVRTPLLQNHGLLDDGIVCVHEHIDAALTATRLGFPVYMEPAARVNYLAFAGLLLEDLPLFRSRWSPVAGEQSIQNFAKKWGVNDDADSFGSVRIFLSNHVGHVDPLCINIPPREDLNTAMRKEELQQTRSDLLDMAMERGGYLPADLALLSNAYFVAQALVDGGYRSCGRPFINHLTGTASVLLRYGFRIEIVAAGLLHAAYSHCPEHPEGNQAAINEVTRKLGGERHKVERLVRGYSLRGMQLPAVRAAVADAGRIPLFEAEVEMIALANEIEMTLSGETRHSAPRNDEMTAAQLARAEKICTIIGVSGMARSLRENENDRPANIPPYLLTRQNMSYRFNTDRSATTPMPGNAKFCLNTEHQS